MRTIAAAALQQHLDRGSDVLLVNVLEPETFEREHIPGSHNVSEDREDFVPQVTELAARKERLIVVYCAGEPCQASVKAGLRLEAVGFTAVSHFKGGMAAWKASAYDAEGRWGDTRPQRRPGSLAVQGAAKQGRVPVARPLRGANRASGRGADKQLMHDALARIQ